MMESPSSEIATSVAKSKKRGFPGSSSSCTEPEVMEIPPPASSSHNRTSRSKAKTIETKEAVYHEIIDVDMDEDRNDVVLVEGKIESNKKMKDVAGVSKSFSPGSDNFFDLDGVGYTTDSYADDHLFEDYYLNLQSHFDSMDIPPGIEAPIPLLPDTTVKMKNKTLTNQSFNPQSKKGKSKKNPSASYWAPQTQNDPDNNSHPFAEIPDLIQPESIPPFYMYDQLGQIKMPGGISPFLGISSTASFSQLPLGMSPKLKKFKKHMKLRSGGGIVPEDGGDMEDGKDVNTPRSSSLAGSSSSMANGGGDNEDVLKRYESFKKFDTVVDHSDHYYSKKNPGMTQPPKNWAKKIQEEWRILEKDLPDTIFVRAYESRMDLLRAVIIGAEGTPYHDGLFFFDVCFPSSYPSVPPLVHYHSGGLRINPNLYNCGKVCLSLLNTWTGGPKERWLPGASTMLQVLVSIQGLILNTKPYFNEPGYAHSSGSAHGDQRSIDYNEKTLILSLKTMVYTMRKPPKHFEDLVIGHFRTRVRDIMMACKAYLEGVQVGCLVRGGVQDVDEEGSNMSCSARFKNDVASYIKTLIGSFKKIGAKETAQEFLYLSEKKFTVPPPPPPQHVRLPHPSHAAAAALAVPPPPPPFGGVGFSSPAFGFPMMMPPGGGPAAPPAAAGYNQYW